MSNCRVVNCRNSKKNVAPVQLHTFPREEERFQKWAEASGRDDLSMEEKNLMCSEHFADHCYRLQDILLKVNHMKRRLNENAVPTLNLPYLEEDQDVAFIERKKIIDDLLKKHAEEKKQEKKHMMQDKAVQTFSISEPIVMTNIQRDLQLKSRYLDSLGWKVGQQQAEIFRLNRQLARFRKFFSPEEAVLIAEGQMVPVGTEREAVKEEIGEPQDGEADDDDVLPTDEMLGLYVPENDAADYFEDDDDEEDGLGMDVKEDL